VFRREAADDAEGSFGAIERCREQFDDCFVCGGIYGRGGNLDLQLCADDVADAVLRGARLNFDREHYFCVRLCPEIRGQVHEVAAALWKSTFTGARSKSFAAINVCGRMAAIAATKRSGTRSSRVL